MGPYQDPVQRAVVCLPAVMGALLHGALDAFVGIAVHSVLLLLLLDRSSMAPGRKTIPQKTGNIWKSDFSQPSLFHRFFHRND